MNRWQIICVACMSAVIAVAGISAAIAALSWKLTVEGEVSELTLLSQDIIERTEFVYRDAVRTLRELEASKLAHCSEPQIAEMRQATANSRYISGMGIFEDGILRCSAWGAAETRIVRGPYDFLTKDGIEITLNVRPRMSESAPRVALFSNDHFVLLNADFLLDGFTNPTDHFAIVFKSNFVVATRNSPNPQLLRSLIADPRGGIDDRNVFSATRKGELLAVSIASREKLTAAFARRLLSLSPIGVLLACLVVGAIAWQTRRRLSLFGELSAAVRRGEFIAHYQPIIEIKTGRCVGAEALVRWERQGGQITMPCQFLDLAESTDLILPITDQVIDCVIRDLGAILRNERAMHVSINLSASDVSNGRGVKALDRKLKDTGIPKTQIWLEATERGLLDIDSARDSIVRANEAGYSVAIDDFGTGYSSLQYLESLPFRALKIDKSFVDTIGKLNARTPLLPHIIGIARSLKLACVAEGVETLRQLEYLRRADVKFAQGWLFSKALPANEFIEFFHAHQGQTLVGNNSADQQIKATEKASEPAMVRRTMNETEPRVLRMAAPLGIGQIVLPPILAFAESQSPNLRVELVFNDNLVDPVKEGVDISLRLGECGTGNYSRMPLGHVRRILVAAPSYLEAYGNPLTFEDLDLHRFLRVEGTFNSNRLTLICPNQSFKLAPLTIAESVDSWRPLRDKLLSGEGIGVLQEPICREDLASGRLVHVLPDLAVPGFDLYALYAAQRPLSPEVDAMLSILQERLPPNIRTKQYRL